ncbi:hypothetical protein [Parapedobacter sp. DT-150]|uniref:hypothetical protein n=1 Tax=Parapedobacter sp. DT-150 TaxID=3396162 RepID=UPI003F1C9AB8
MASNLARLPTFPYALSVPDPCDIPVISHHTPVKTPKDGILSENHRESIGKKGLSDGEKLS